MAKIKLMITIEEEDLVLARAMAVERELITRGSILGPRGNVAALIGELIREEIDRNVDRMILD